jgi:agmatinase
MDPDRLEALRRKYADAKGGDIFDPAFASVAAQAFVDPGKRKWPFAGVATFLAAPMLAPDPAAVGSAREFGDIDVALVGVPMDLGVTNRAGARLGPRAVRAVERIGPYEHALKIAPMNMLKVADIGDVPMTSRFSLSQCIADIEAFFDRLRAANVIPLAVGGDHSITYPIMKALGRDRPLAMVHIDAHCDSAGEYEGSKFHHGGPFRQAVLAGVLDPERSIQIGIRGGAEYLWEFSYESGMTVLHAEEVAEMGTAAVVARARAVVGDCPTYVTFDRRRNRPGLRARHGARPRSAGSRRVRRWRSFAAWQASTSSAATSSSGAAVRRDDQHRARRCADALHRAVPRRRESRSANPERERHQALGRALPLAPRSGADAAFELAAFALSAHAVRSRVVPGARARARARRDC